MVQAAVLTSSTSPHLSPKHPMIALMPSSTLCCCPGPAAPPPHLCHLLRLPALVDVCDDGHAIGVLHLLQNAAEGRKREGRQRGRGDHYIDHMLSFSTVDRSWQLAAPCPPRPLSCSPQTLLHAGPTEGAGAGAVGLVKGALEHQLDAQAVCKCGQLGFRVQPGNLRKAAPAGSIAAAAATASHAPVTALIWRHIFRQCSSDWITLGPAIRKKGWADLSS